jgi:hypothetical protein
MVKYWFEPMVKDKDKKIEQAIQWHDEIQQSITVDQWYVFDKLTVQGSKNNNNDLALTYTVKSGNDLEEMKGTTSRIEHSWKC